MTGLISLLPLQQKMFYSIPLQQKMFCTLATIIGSKRL